MMNKEIKISEIILESFFDFWRAVRDMSYTFYVCHGGRNSAKSTHISLAIIVLGLISLPINILCVRKVEKTLAGSVYEQLKEAINILGIEDQFSFGVSPLKITYKPRGNYIIFRGADKPEKIKSIKTAKFPIAWLWIEELADFRTEEEVQTILDSIIRAELAGGLKYKILYSYNPPKRKAHWVNKKFNTTFIDANTFVHKSTYLDNHKLGAQVLQVIENMRLKDERKYRWNYLGEVTGGGIVPFEHLVFKTITDAEIKSFDNIRQGIDWGYATDPVAFGRMHLDAKHKKLFIFDEIYGVKMSNRKLAEEIIKRGYQHVNTICGHDEPKSKDELREYGIRASVAKAGPGSVEYGEKWLDDLSEIVIDSKRCPNTAREFEAIDYEVDAEGNATAKLCGIDNHTIDMTRYACENDMRRGGVGFFH